MKSAHAIHDFVQNVRDEVKTSFRSTPNAGRIACVCDIWKQKYEFNFKDNITHFMHKRLGEI
jgi:hypothetical protein